MQGRALYAWGLPRALPSAVYVQMTACERPPGPSAIWTGSETCRSNHVSLHMAEGTVWDLATLWSCSPGREPGLKFRISKLEQGVGQPQTQNKSCPSQFCQAQEARLQRALCQCPVVDQRASGLHGQMQLGVAELGPHPGPRHVFQAQYQFRGTSWETRWPAHI